MPIIGTIKVYALVANPHFTGLHVMMDTYMQQTIGSLATRAPMAVDGWMLVELMCRVFHTAVYQNVVGLHVHAGDTSVGKRTTLLSWHIFN